MMCTQLQPWLDDQLDDMQRTAFQSHLAQCTDCAATVARWRLTQAELQDWATHRTGAPVTPADVTRLVAHAKPRRIIPWWQVLAMGAALAASILWLFPVDEPGVLSAPPFAESSAPTQPIATPLKVTLIRGDAPSWTGRELRGSEKGALARIGDDVVGVGMDSTLELSRADQTGTTLTLRGGQMAAEVAKRTPVAPFTVLAGEIRIIVIGTRFLVGENLETGGWDVQVAQGTVDVEWGTHQQRVQAGYLLQVLPNSEALLEPSSSVALDALLERVTPPTTPASSPPSPSTTPTPPAPPPPELAELRRWVVNGRLDEAAAELETRLRLHPDDGAAATLLGDLMRKQGRHEAAIVTYLEVRGTMSSAARYKAALLLQDELSDHQRAIDLFRTELDAGTLGVLEPDARKRLAVSLTSLGRIDEARAMLESVITRHPGSGAAVSAQQLLQELAP